MLPFYVQVVFLFIFSIYLFDLLGADFLTYHSCLQYIKNPFSSNWSGGHCACHLWIAGSTNHLAGAAEPVPNPDRGAESVDAAP